MQNEREEEKARDQEPEQEEGQEDWEKRESHAEDRGRRLACDPARKQEKMSWIPHGMRQGVEMKPLDLLSGKLC